MSRVHKLKGFLPIFVGASVRTAICFPQMISVQTKPFFQRFVFHSINRDGLFVRLCYRSGISLA